LTRDRQRLTSAGNKFAVTVIRRIPLSFGGYHCHLIDVDRSTGPADRHLDRRIVIWTGGSSSGPADRHLRICFSGSVIPVTPPPLCFGWNTNLVGGGVEIRVLYSGGFIIRYKKQYPRQFSLVYFIALGGYSKIEQININTRASPDRLHPHTDTRLQSKRRGGGGPWRQPHGGE